ncbi:MAG TPA: hypothetical protein VHM25_21385 [Polyangiaceae bacterium]|jgi:hypothetical protein|nr:hypothetical protein [Polyangiaceae bacterium]
MLSERLQLKLYLEPSEHFEVEALIPVFHRFIRDQVLKDLVIDVVDYSHVPDGPGVVLIGHAADYYVGALDGAFGLVFSRKRGGPGPEARLEDALRRLVNVARLLEQENGLKLRFKSNELSLRLTDRLHAPNDDATFASTQAEVQALLGRVYGGAAAIERLPGSKEPLSLRIQAASAPSLEALLEKLGGPPSTAA